MAGRGTVLAVLGGAVALALGVAGPAAAAVDSNAGSQFDREVVRPADISADWSQDWSTADTRPGGTVSIVTTYGAPAGLGRGSVQLTTDATNAAKAQIMTQEGAGTPLSQVSRLSYWTYQQSGPAHAAAGFNLVIDANGPAPGGFATLVWEPYQNGTVLPQTWQFWDLTQGKWWSTRQINGVAPSPGGPPTATLGQIAAWNPDAVVLGFGANVGSYNPSYVVATDGLTFNETTYDFEPAAVGCEHADGKRSDKARGDCEEHSTRHGS